MHVPLLQVDEVKNIMSDNIEKVLSRGEKLDLLVDKTDNLMFEVITLLGKRDAQAFLQLAGIVLQCQQLSFIWRQQQQCHDSAPWPQLWAPSAAAGTASAWHAMKTSAQVTHTINVL
jgi:hypothetical protein